MASQGKSSKTSFKGKKQFPAYKSDSRSQKNARKNQLRHLKDHPKDEVAAAASKVSKKHRTKPLTKRKIATRRAWILRDAAGHVLSVPDFTPTDKRGNYIDNPREHAQVSAKDSRIGTAVIPGEELLAEACRRAARLEHMREMTDKFLSSGVPHLATEQKINNLINK